MSIRLFALCLVLLPTATLAQQSTYPGECGHPRNCPAGQILDTASKTCVAISS